MTGAKRFLFIGCHVLWREICYFASMSNNIFNFRFLKQGLHCTPDILRAELQKAIDEAENEAENEAEKEAENSADSKGNKDSKDNKGYDAILIGYGLCSNGTAGIKARKTRLVMMRGHDCITFFLGSKQRYREYFDSHPGTYWYTPGWIDTSPMPGKDRYEQALKIYIDKYGEDNGAYLMEMESQWYRQYSNVAYVETGILDAAAEAGYKKYSRECAEWLKWNYDELRGDTGLIKRFVGGDWDNEDFLVVEPGQTICFSNDESILGVY